MLRKLWFQTHWLLGISAGLVLAIMGLSGATLAFEDEIIEALNPQVLKVRPQGQPLPVSELAARAQSLRPQTRLQALTIFADGQRAARAAYAGREPRQRRGEQLYLNPYDGRITGSEAQLRGHAFLHFVEDLHRRLAAGEIGKAITGACVLILLLMVSTGLYLRWPRRARSWRSWLRVDVPWRGRAFWWNLHAVAGTLVLPFYLLSAGTGLFWSYDWYRDALQALAGEPRQPRSAFGGEGGRAGERGREAVPGLPDLQPAWTSFVQQVPDYRQVSLNLPQRPGEALQFNYLDADAPHERAQSRIRIAADGRVLERQAYAGKRLGGQLIASIFPLHAGSFFGWPGRLLMFAASLLMPLFFISGWVLYLERRGRQRRAQQRVTAGEAQLG